MTLSQTGPEKTPLGNVRLQGMAERQGGRDHCPTAQAVKPDEKPLSEKRAIDNGELG